MSFSKVEIKGDIVALSGLHVGTSAAFSPIGAIDNPVIKDPLTNLPYIPGSTLKGKMRSLLARAYNDHQVDSPEKDDQRIIRLFGKAADKKNADGEKESIQGRLLFRDAFLNNKQELMDKGLELLTEDKFENSISRSTAIANPRQIERAVKGSKFTLDLIYDVEDIAEFDTDFKTIVDGLQLLEEDYLGGSGTRGYGQIKFKNITVKTVIGDYQATNIAKLWGNFR